MNTIATIAQRTAACGRGDSARQFLAVTRGLLIALAMSASSANAGPQGGEVVAGQGNIDQSGPNSTIVNQSSQNLTIDWQSFNVGADESVRFNQPSSSAAALNRIHDQNASQIFGAVEANGRIFLMNPNGVIFAPGSRVSVGSLFATSFEIDVQDFMQGDYRFENRGDAGMIVNRGLLEAATGGSINLFGGAVSNEGVILARLGTVNLAAGERVTLDFDGDGLTRFQVDGEILNNIAATEAAVSNSGEIHADGGEVLLSASAARDVFSQVVNNQGIISANRIDNSGGVIRLLGSGGEVANSGVLDASADGASTRAGEITLAGDDVTHSGEIHADSAGGDGGRVQIDSNGITQLDGGAISAVSQAGQGGSIDVFGNWVGLFGDTRIDASGERGGGRVLVGGDFQGSNEAVHNASRTYVGQEVQIRADAGAAGDGGTVVVWADEITRYYGTISATGGAASGDGGDVEVSGKQSLGFHGAVDLGAGNGRGGTLLLDPDNIILNATTQSAPPDNTPDGTVDVAFDDPGTLMTIEIDDIVGVSELYLQAAIDIDIDSALTMDTNGNVRFEAGRNINVDADITVDNNGGNIATITLIADADFSAGGGAASDNDGRIAGAGTLSQESGTMTLRAGSGIAVNTANTDTMVIDAGTTTGDLSITNSVGAVDGLSISGTVAGTLQVINNANNADIDLATAATADTIILTTNGTGDADVLIDQVLTADNFTLTGADDVELLNGAQLNATNDIDIVAGEDVELLATSSITTNSMIANTGVITVNAVEQVVIAATSSITNMNVFSDAATTAITINADSDGDDSGDINAAGTIAVNSGRLTLSGGDGVDAVTAINGNADNASILADVSGAGNLTLVNNAGDIRALLLGSAVTGTLDLSNNGGDLLIDQALSASNGVNLSASDDLRLLGTGSVANSGGAITLAADNDVEFATGSSVTNTSVVGNAATGRLSITADADGNGAGAISGEGMLAINSGLLDLGAATGIDVNTAINGLSGNARILATLSGAGDVNITNATGDIEDLRITGTMIDDLAVTNNGGQIDFDGNAIAANSIDLFTTGLMDVDVNLTASGDVDITAGDVNFENTITAGDAMTPGNVTINTLAGDPDALVLGSAVAFNGMVISADELRNIASSGTLTIGDTVDQTSGIQLGSEVLDLSATNYSLSLLSAGTINDFIGTGNVLTLNPAGRTLTLDAGTSIGANNAIRTDASILTADAGTTMAVINTNAVLANLTAVGTIDFTNTGTADITANTSGAIFVDNTGGATANLTATGAIDFDATGATTLTANSGAGIDVDNGSDTTANLTAVGAVDFSNAGTANLTVNSGGAITVVNGDTATVNLSSMGAIDIDNTGSVSGTTGTTDLTVTANGGNITLANTGALTNLALNATGGAAGNIDLSNTGTLNTGATGINARNAISLSSTGAMAINGALNATDGSVMLASNTIDVNSAVDAGTTLSVVADTLTVGALLDAGTDLTLEATDMTVGAAVSAANDTTLRADDLALNSTASATSGNVRISTRSAGASVLLGGADPLLGNQLHLSDAELAALNTNATLIIGNGGADNSLNGNITMAAAGITSADNLTLATNGSIGGGPVSVTGPNTLLTLNAGGSIGAGSALATSATRLAASAGGAELSINNTGSLTDTRLSADNGSLNFSTTGSLTTGNTLSANSIALASADLVMNHDIVADVGAVSITSSGSITNTGGSSNIQVGAGQALTLSATGSIGAGDAVNTVATVIDATAQGAVLALDNTGSVSDLRLNAAVGAITFRTDGDINTGAAIGANSIELTSTAGTLTVDQALTSNGGAIALNADGDFTQSAQIDAQGGVSVDSSNGSISMVPGASTRSAGGSIAYTAVNGAATFETLTAANNQVRLSARDNILLNDDITTAGGTIAVTSDTGSLSMASGSQIVSGGANITLRARETVTVRTVDAATVQGTTIDITSTGGNIFMAGSNSFLRAGAINLNASLTGEIGTRADPIVIHPDVTGTVTPVGLVFVGNEDGNYLVNENGVGSVSFVGSAANAAARRAQGTGIDTVAFVDPAIFADFSLFSVDGLGITLSDDQAEVAPFGEENVPPPAPPAEPESESSVSTGIELAAPAVTVTPPVQLATAAPAEPSPEQRSAPPAALREFDRLQDAQWLLKQPPTNYAVQVVATFDPARLRDFIKRNGIENNVAYYKTKHSGTDWYVLLYGNYRNRDAARRAIDRLPEPVRRNQPFARGFASVHKIIRGE